MTQPRVYMVQYLDYEVQPTDWLADSGSSHHMTDQRSWFKNFTAVPAGTWPVQAVGGHTASSKASETFLLRFIFGISGSRVC